MTSEDWIQMKYVIHFIIRLSKRCILQASGLVICKYNKHDTANIYNLGQTHFVDCQYIIYIKKRVCDLQKDNSVCVSFASVMISSSVYWFISDA